MDQQFHLLAISVTFWVSEAIVFLIVMVPVSRFFTYGWKIRKEDFTNRIEGKQISTYLDRFWASTIDRNRWRILSQPQQFSRVYDVIAGRRIYLMPIALLAACLLLFGGLAVQSAIRMGYEWYVQSYMAAEAAEKDVFTQTINHAHLETLNSIFTPFPPLLLNVSALTAVAGAYLAVVQIAIFGYKTRTLLSSDLLWASFRLVIAIPLGYAVSSVVAQPLGGLIGFGLGAFPIDSVIKLLRRLTSRSFNEAEVHDHDDLLKMIGVTPDISSRLNDEGIFAPSQLADTDPVSLAIRAGLSFDFVLNLVAQSQVWSFLADTTAKIAPLGYGDARTIRRFFATPQVGAVSGQILSALAEATGIDAQALQPVLTVIANDPFTEFLSAL
jgi:hypothetical protein